MGATLSKLLEKDGLRERLNALRAFSNRVRSSEYHLTKACNIRCKGCWFFEYGFDNRIAEVVDVQKLRDHISREKDRGINSAILIGGEPTLFPERIAEYVSAMEFVTLSTNGYKPFPTQGFENVQVFVSIFGGGDLDDDLRAIKPNGHRFSGLFDKALENYRNDPRVTFVFAITEEGIQNIQETVRRIEDNGNRLTFNYYSKHGSGGGACGDVPFDHEGALVSEALRVRELHPRTVVNTEYYIKALINGRSHWGESFGYETCPSISNDHPMNRERIASGHKVLPLFNTFAPDLKTIEFCCTSGHCDECRDSQAVYSWLLVSAGRFLRNPAFAEAWIDLAEGYWKQFVWSPFK